MSTLCSPNVVVLFARQLPCHTRCSVAHNNFKGPNSRQFGLAFNQPRMPHPTTAGIVFIDEIDKIVTSSEHRYGGDASAEGVQRDLLPIIEGGCWAQCDSARCWEWGRSCGSAAELSCVLDITWHIICVFVGLSVPGSTVSTKHGNVNTDYILFICSGAFHSCKPADMLAELQGRLPIRVELKGLT